MSKYLIRGNYVGDGVKGLLTHGGSSGARRQPQPSRPSAAPSTACITRRSTDLYAICDIPDAASAAVVSLLINSSGAVKIDVTPLLTPEDLTSPQPSHRRIVRQEAESLSPEPGRQCPARSFRPEVTVAGEVTPVLVEQLGADDAQGLGRRVGRLHRGRSLGCGRSTDHGARPGVIRRRNQHAQRVSVSCHKRATSNESTREITVIEGQRNPALTWTFRANEPHDSFPLFRVALLRRNR